MRLGNAMAVSQCGAMDAAGLLAQGHATLLRTLSAGMGRHFEGLAQAARSHPSLPRSLKKKLIQLDSAHNYARHVTKPLIDSFVRDVSAALEDICLPCLSLELPGATPGTTPPVVEEQCGATVHYSMDLAPPQRRIHRL